MIQTTVQQKYWYPNENTFFSASATQYFKARGILSQQKKRASVEWSTPAVNQRSLKVIFRMND